MKTDEKSSVLNPETQEARQQALKAALAQIEKKFGKGSVMKPGDNAAMKVDVIYTASLGGENQSVRGAVLTKIPFDRLPE